MKHAPLILALLCLAPLAACGVQRNLVLPKDAHQSAPKPDSPQGPQSDEPPVMPVDDGTGHHPHTM